MLLRFITWFFVVYILFRFVTRFVVPIFRVTKMTRDQLRKMQGQMEDMHQKVNNHAQPRQHPAVDGDYVDYEEVK